MSKNTRITVMGLMVVASVFTSRLVYADGDIPLYIENMTLLPEDVVKRGAEFYLNLNMDTLLYIEENSPNHNWNPHKNEINDVLLIPVYDLKDNLVAYIALGYCGEGNMPNFDDIITDLRPLISQYEQSPEIKPLFNEGIEYEHSNESWKSEMDMWQLIWEDWHLQYEDKFENSYMYGCIYPFLEASIFKSGKDVGDQIVGYWLAYDKLNMLYPGEEVQFKQYTYYDGVIFSEFKVGEKKILVSFNSIGQSSFIIKEKDTLQYTSLLGYTSQYLLDSKKKFWDYFINYDEEKVQQYFNEEMDMFKRH